MAEKPKGPGRKRPAPTIDLTATEVKPAENKPDSDFVDKALAWLRALTSIATLASAVIGGAIVALVLAVLWFVGRVPDRYTQAAVVMPQNLDARLTKIEDALAKMPAGIDARSAAADNAMKSIGIALAALNKRVEESAAATADMRAKLDAAEKAAAARGETQAALEKRIGALEAAAKATHEQIAKNSGADAAARLALSAAALRDAVARGAPYAAEFSAAKSLAGDQAKALAPLESFAATGIPTDKQLANELHALLPKMLKASGAPPNASFFEKLQANAGNLVRISPVDAPPGNDVTSVLARLETDIVGANIGDLVADIELLPPSTRAPAEDWLRRAKAKQAAMNTAREFAASAARALSNR